MGGGLLQVAVASPCWLRLMLLSQSIATVKTNYEVLHSRKVVQFKALLHICYWSLYLATDYIDVLFRVPQCYLFCSRTFLAHPRVLRNETVSQVIVTTATSVKKCFLLSTNFMYLNKKSWFLWAIRISLLAKSSGNSHSFFLWVVLLNLTTFWVRENNAFIFRTQKSVNIKAELFGVELSTNNSMSDFAWHGPGTFYISVFTWRHGVHICVPKQWNGGHVGVPNQSCGRWTLFLCKHFLLFQ